MSKPERLTQYRHIGHFVLRTPLLPLSEIPVDGDAALLDIPVHSAIVANALEISAPGLDVSRVSAATDTARDAKRAERLRRTVKRYMTRMSSRATPFGLMAGVSAHRFCSDGELLQLGDKRDLDVFVRPDMGWVYALYDQVIDGPNRKDDLRYLWNDAAQVDGSRISVFDTAFLAQEKRESTRIRLTRAVELIRRVSSADDVHRSDLLAALAEEFDPVTDSSRMAALVETLIESGFLAPQVVPQLLTANLSEEIAMSLEALGDPSFTEKANTIRGVSGRFAASAFDPRITRKAFHDALPDFGGETIEVHSLRRTNGGVLPTSIGADVANAAAFILAVSRGAGDGSLEHDRPLAKYHSQFVERYGVGSAVPIGELLDDAKGLGIPPHYLPGAPADLVFSRTARLTSYERVLLDLLTSSWHSHAHTLNIDKGTENRLLDALPDDRPGRLPYPAVDVFVQLARAATADDTDPWTVVLNPLPVTRGGASTARFLHLLDGSHRAAFQEHSFGVLAGHAGLLVAEVNYVPSSGRAANVSVHPPTLSCHIGLNTATPTGVDRLPLSDVHVVASFAGLELWSSRSNTELIVTENHLLSQADAPFPLRLMSEITERRFGSLGGFSWGPFEGSLRLPRVQRRGVVLRVAEWTIVPEELHDVSTVETTLASLKDWRVRWEAPAEVYVVVADQRLLVDLRTSDGADEIRTALSASHQVRLQEFYPGRSDTWLIDNEGDSYLPELAIPVVAHTKPIGGHPPTLVHSPAPHRYRQADIRLPGGVWTYLKLYATPAFQNQILNAQLRGLVVDALEQELITQWFFIRYSDTGHHLRVRFRSPNVDQAHEFFKLVCEWANSLVSAGLASNFEFASHSPEIGRYGGPEVFGAIEDLFCTESETTVAILAAERSLGLREDERLTAVMRLDTITRAWGYSTQERLELAESLASQGDTKRVRDTLYRPWKKQLVEGLRAVENFGATAASPLLVSMHEDAVAAHRARERLDIAREDGKLVGNERTILESVLHMTLNRCITPGNSSELDCYVLWKLGLHAVGSVRSDALV